ncbi:conserved hypothetical protein [Pseudarthrobacter chlorophenolicus A6]|uniref:Uncharacterized protein n=1 Tax=Pseudarthrobacter chlorophenolicus (strain ATCC 700700 / DSM 12829 / CIP 107037 / JCM 12360 / KCTC 9906 / NCIMB 13794 / A6) TaxID=452863 RepID=B8HED4_PSECP|nr:hypothetical protein [Pseudarthrobacter chlorophenolicus]ACL40879.1 conserved hypothetical protein [Pseudarthrobacter chlorophenolicus A6]SDQ73533.1 hypothetical protein SAMN04489738_2564 [Pseudarthrobacter chlorophenolicus]
MRPMTKKNKVAAVAVSAALLAAGGGAAYAYWSTTGSGNGSAAASSGTSPVTINVTVAPGVAPGTPQQITYTATNPNSSSTPVTLAQPVVSTNNAGCLPAWFDATAPTGTTTVLGNANGTALGTGILTLNDDPAVNQDACKGATITVTVASN